MSTSDVPNKTAFNRNRLFLLLAGVVAVAYFALGASLLRHHLDQDRLSSEIGSAEAVLAKADDVGQDVEELPARVAEAQRELWDAQAAFPSKLDGNNITQTVLTLADETGVRVLSFDAPPPVAEPVEEVSGNTSLSFNLRVEGDFGRLVAFLAAMEEGAAGTTRVGTFALSERDGRYVLSLELVSYARSPVEAPSSPEGETRSGGEAGTSGDDEETRGE